MRFVECVVNQGFLNWNIPSLRQTIIFFIDLAEGLEVVNFRCPSPTLRPHGTVCKGFHVFITHFKGQTAIRYLNCDIYIPTINENIFQIGCFFSSYF